MDRYDPDIAPDAEAWLALDARARKALAEAAHPGPDGLHPGGPDAVHPALHAVVETQVASGAPPATGRALDRLVAAGLRRHAAVHMIAEVLLDALASGRIGDLDHLAARLDALDAGDWLGRRMRRELGGP